MAVDSLKLTLSAWWTATCQDSASTVVRRYFGAFTGVGAPAFVFLAGCRYLVKDGPMW